MPRHRRLHAEILLIEYQRLKEEQSQRIGTRDNLIYATLISIAAIMAATFPLGDITVLLLVPPVCFVLGWTYIANDDRVSAITDYLLSTLRPRLESIVEGAVLEWEHAHRADRRRRFRKSVQLTADLTIFILPSCAGLALYWLDGPRSMVFWAVSLLESLAVLCLAAIIIVQAGRSRRPRAAT